MIDLLFHLHRRGTEPFRTLSSLLEIVTQIWNHEPFLEYKRQPLTGRTGNNND